MRLGDIGPVLALSPHTDDVELGAGGFLSLCAENEVKVHVHVFTKKTKYDTLPECERSLRDCLGVNSIVYHEFLNRHFPESEVDIIDILYDLSNLDFKTVIVPATWDTHQDHQTITRCATKSFKHASILGYEQPWNTVGESRLDFFVPFDRRHLNCKLAALSSYETQKGKPYFRTDFTVSLARVRGLQCGEEYAEAFEVIKMIMR